MNYPKKNKLDPFRARLLEWAAEGKSQLEMLASLKADGCSCSGSSLSVYLQRERDGQAEETFLARITSGAQQMKRFDAAFAENPEPMLAQIMARLKVLTAMLSTQAVANPEAFGQLDVLLKYLLDWEKVQIKGSESALAAQKYRDLVAERKRAIEAELGKARTGGGLTPETLERIERELKL